MTTYKEITVSLPVKIGHTFRNSGSRQYIKCWSEIMLVYQTPEEQRIIKVRGAVNTL